MSWNPNVVSIGGAVSFDAAGKPLPVQVTTSSDGRTVTQRSGGATVVMSSDNAAEVQRLFESVQASFRSTQQQLPPPPLTDRVFETPEWDWMNAAANPRPSPSVSEVPEWMEAAANPKPSPTVSAPFGAISTVPGQSIRVHNQFGGAIQSPKVTNYYGVVASVPFSSVSGSYDWGYKGDDVKGSSGPKLISSDVRHQFNRLPYPTSHFESYGGVISMADYIASDAMFVPGAAEYQITLGKMLNRLIEMYHNGQGTIPASTVYIRTEPHCRLLLACSEKPVPICWIGSDEYECNGKVTVVAYPLKGANQGQNDEIRRSLQIACQNIDFRLHWISEFCEPVLPTHVVNSYGGHIS